ncbi:MAG TPA: SRPBCC domain-containing protein [Gemmatimonadaceae bacterium]|nr:SRPBCC domain-containing protein [Gemmatimonadaceae bacterium]
MTAHDASRRDFARQLAVVALGSATLAGVPKRLLAARVAQHEGDIIHDEQSIHQVVNFKAAPLRVYGTLTDPREFLAIMKFSTVPNAPLPEISAREGAKFALFGGHILGRNIELVPGARVVQAWRTSGWPTGLYSMVRMELQAAGSGTTLTFDHTGFPKADAEHLAAGWYLNYWTPMQKHFG